MKTPNRTIRPVAQQDRAPVRVTMMASSDALDMISWLTNRTSQGVRRRRKTVDMLGDMALFFENRNNLTSRSDCIVQLLSHHEDNTGQISIALPTDMDVEDPLDVLLAKASIGLKDKFLGGVRDLVAGRLQTKRKTFVFTQQTVANVERMQKVFEGFLGPVTRSQSKTFELMLRIYYCVERENAPVFSDQEFLVALEMERSLNTLDHHFGEACNTLKKLMTESGIEESPSDTERTNLITEEELLARGYNPLRAALANMITIRHFLDQYSRGWCRAVRQMTDEERANRS